MKIFKILNILLIILFLFGCDRKSVVESSSFSTVINQDANGFNYEIVENDPTGLRLYSLKNGLKVYLGINNEEPKTQTLIAVRVGSTYDPEDNTGFGLRCFKKIRNFKGFRY